MIGHTSDLGSFKSAYWGFPETGSAIVALTNSSSSDGDPSNIVTQVLMQALFDLKPVIDFVKVASEVVAEAREGWNRAVDAWMANRLSGTQSRELRAYTGIYPSTNFCMTLKVSALSEHDPRPLRLYINDLPDQTFDLHHYHHDSWSLLPESRDKCLEFGMGYSFA